MLGLGRLRPSLDSNDNDDDENHNDHCDIATPACLDSAIVGSTSPFHEAVELFELELDCVLHMHGFKRLPPNFCTAHYITSHDLRLASVFRHDLTLLIYASSGTEHTMRLKAS